MATLMKMFAWMEVCGLVGSSYTFEVFYDGDGRAKLEFDFGELQSVYENIKHIVMAELDNSQTGHPRFNFD